jgi:hypothetical protein
MRKAGTMNFGLLKHEMVRICGKSDGYRASDIRAKDQAILLSKFCGKSTSFLAR